MGNDSILPECGGLSDYSDTKERKEMPQGGWFLLSPVRAFLCDGQFLFVGYLFFPPYLPGRVSIKGSVLLG